MNLNYILSVENLVCGYRDTRFFLKDINFKVNKGEILGIIGPNGAGKSTLLRGITKALPPLKGRVTFKNRDVLDYGYKELARSVAVVTQTENEMIRGLSVSEFVLLGRIPHRRRMQFLETKMDFTIAKKAMTDADIIQYSDRDISQLSSGEKQRAAIARALCQQPELVILDEPVSHLDIGHQTEILNLLKILNKAGLTVIMILHDLNLASAYCDRLILMSDGAVHSAGTPEDILNNETINTIYKTSVIVERHPVSSKPLICVCPEV